MKRRNPYRIPAAHLPYVLARLNIAAAAAAIGSDKLAVGNLRDDIDGLVRLARKQTIASGKGIDTRPKDEGE